MYEQVVLTRCHEARQREQRRRVAEKRVRVHKRGDLIRGAQYRHRLGHVAKEELAAAAEPAHVLVAERAVGRGVEMRAQLEH